MWEIDKLIKKSRDFILSLTIDNKLKRNLIWSLEKIPDKYKFDAGGYEHLEKEKADSYEVFSPFEIGLIIIQNSEKTMF